MHEPPGQPLVSLIVVTYNSASLLLAFFTTLTDTAYAPYEIIAVDNASTDATLSTLAAHSGVRVLAQPHNLGFGRACNLGAAAAHGELLIFLNPDVTFTPGWLARLVATAAQRPDAAILCPDTRYPHEGAQMPENPPIEEWAAVPGSAMLVRRSDWQALGGFDEQIFMYWEDVDLCWRAWLAGCTVLIDRGAIVFHTRGGSGGGTRWAAEAAKNGLYVHLKLMRWRYSLTFIARLAVTTLVRGLRGRPGMAEVWLWNLRQLRQTLATRRAIRATRMIDPARLERLARQHTQAQRKARR
jgi:GT2 family glycosyltransferase